MMETRAVSFQHSSTTNLSRFKDEIDAADNWVTKELRRHRWQSVCVCRDPFTIGRFYLLSSFDNDLGSKQNHEAD